jgi:hypothetical protein
MIPRKNTFHSIVYVILCGKLKITSLAKPFLASSCIHPPVFALVHCKVKSHLTQRLHFNTSELGRNNQLSNTLGNSLGRCHLENCYILLLTSITTFSPTGKKSLFICTPKKMFHVIKFQMIVTTLIVAKISGI